MMAAKYADGYQDALHDVLVKWQLDGPEAALTYIKDNYREENA